MTVFWRILNAFMGAVFVFAALLQINDDDPLRWMALYAAGALPCILVVVRRPSVLLPAAVAAIAIVWAGVYAAQGAWSVPPGEMFAEWEMKNEEVLRTREMVGLSIVAVWMAVVVVVNFVARPKS